MITDTSDTPTASGRLSPNPSVRSGTIRIPPPSPSKEPNAPATAPPPSMTSPTGTSGRHRLGGRPVTRTGSGAQVLRRVREEGDVSGALERDRQLALVAGARAGLPARLDLGPLGQVATEAVDLLVVDLDGLVGAERTDLP